MTGFEADWLALRAGADDAARSQATELMMRRAPLPARAVHVVDLGAGSGNNALHLAPHLARRGIRRQLWTLVDDDAALLERAAERLRAPKIEVVAVRCDLANDLRRVPFEGAHLVTCSALLDLVSHGWLTVFGDAVRAAEVGVVHAALTIDGSVEWSPHHPFDARATAAFHADMRRDKGFGPALAEEASDGFSHSLRPWGYRLGRSPSPWTLGPDDAALQRRYLDDVAAVVAQREPADETEVWRARRAAWIDEGVSGLVVGHWDTHGILYDFD